MNWHNFFRKSFILQVYDVLAKRSHKLGDKVADMTLRARLDEIRKVKSNRWLNPEVI